MVHVSLQKCAVDVRLEIGIDSCQPERLLPFWLAALGYQRGGGDGRPYIDLVPPADAQGPVVFLQRVPEPKVGKNRLHLDLYVSDPEGLTERLEGLGATRIGGLVTDADGQWNYQVMGDPEGNECCI